MELDPKELSAALRSGEYKQSKNRLRSNNGFCCLGVAFDLLVKKGCGKWDHCEETNIYTAVTKEDETLYRLPCDVSLGPHFSGTLGWFINNDKIREKFKIDTPVLSGLNDSGMSFNEIADVIDTIIGENLES